MTFQFAGQDSASFQISSIGSETSFHSGVLDPDKIYTLHMVDKFLSLVKPVTVSPLSLCPLTLIEEHRSLVLYFQFGHWSYIFSSVIAEIGVLAKIVWQPKEGGLNRA